MPIHVQDTFTLLMFAVLSDCSKLWDLEASCALYLSDVGLFS